MFKFLKTTRNKARKIDIGFGFYAEKVSRILWPWSDLRLLILTGVLTALDYLSTYALLEFSGITGIYESGPVAGWALEKGGFPFLLLVDVAEIAVLSSIALGARRIYTVFGFRAYGRAAFVFVLTPYIAVTIFAILSNIFMQFR